MSPETQQEINKLSQRIAELERELSDIRKAKGVREFIDNDVVVLRKLYAEKLYTKRSGTYVELTS